MVKIKLIPAEFGECIVVSVGGKKQFNLLIDGGVAKTYQEYVKSEIQRIKILGQRINLMVCTHMDNDHISGLVQILQKTNYDLTI